MQFTRVRKGYDPQEVEAYLDQLTGQMQEQEQQLAAYRRQEASIQERALQAQQKADAILAQAHRRADQVQQDCFRELSDIREQALAMRDTIEAFQNEYNQLLRQYLLQLRTEEFPALMDRLGALLEKTGGEMLQKQEEQ